LATSRRTTRGSSFIEALLGGFILIIIALALLDLIVLVSATSMNDSAAKVAARAAADQQDENGAKTAALNALGEFKPTMLTTISLKNVVWTTDRVTVVTTMQVRFPVPFPGHSEQVLDSSATEPVIAAPKESP
jgi:Flp pilus assembly protein TadG